MSLILEALRKSEAERRRGQSPDVFAATPGLSPSRPTSPRVWPLLLLGAMLLGSAWLIWQAGRAPAPEAADAVPARAEPPPRVIVLPAPAPPPAASADHGTRTDASAARTAANPDPPAPVSAAPRAALPPPPAPAAPIPQAQTPAEPPAAEPELPPLAVLDASARAALPPLKLTMHVYAEDPARRFAIVDGQRVGEGARLGPAVVAQIRRDGVVIDVDGRRLLLPKP